MATYITRLERAFQIAYGHEKLTAEAQDAYAFLYSQLQAGLKLTLMESPAVSGSLSHKQLCIAAKQEEQQLVGLKRRRQYSERTARNGERGQLFSHNFNKRHSNTTSDSVEQTEQQPARKCYVCGSTTHLARDCKQKKTELKKNAVAKANSITSVDTDPIM